MSLLRGYELGTRVQRNNGYIFVKVQDEEGAGIMMAEARRVWELQRAIGADESSRDYRKIVADGLDAPSTTDWSKQLPAGDQETEPEPPPETTQKSTEPEIPFGR